MPLILEGLVTTDNADGTLNVAPLGPIVDREVQQLTLLPYATSRTLANLRARRCGAFHVTDDVELLAKAAVGLLAADPPASIRLTSPPVSVLTDACRWFAFQVEEIDDRAERVRVQCQIQQRGSGREFFGWNRAKHAVVEGAILATRLGILPAAAIRQDWDRLAVLVQKTGGDQEQRAWELLTRHFRSHLPESFPG